MSQKIGVLVNCPINLENRKELPRFFDLYFSEEVSDRNELLAKIGNKIEIIISDGPRLIDKHLMDQMPNLKLISLQSVGICLLYTSPSPRDRTRSRMPSSA